jgi:outer membrane lipoprotein LolB
MRGPLAAMVVLLLAGCASVPAPPPDATDWPARRLELQALSNWQLQGRIAVATATDGFSGGFDWQQAGARAEIQVRAPLGGTALRLVLDGDRFEMMDGHGTVVTGAVAGQQLEEVLGAPLPVAELRYWLVGVPAPGAIEREVAGPDGRLVQLAQSGWEVRYDRYQAVGARWLPARLELVTTGARLRVVAGHWRIDP